MSVTTLKVIKQEKPTRFNATFQLTIEDMNTSREEYADELDTLRNSISREYENEDSISWVLRRLSDVIRGND